MISKITNLFMKMPEDDIAIKLISKLHNIDVDRDVNVIENGGSTTRVWSFKFRIEELDIHIECSFNLRVGSNISIKYKLMVDKLEMRCKDKYIKKLIDLAENELDRMRDVDNDLIRKDIRVILNRI